VDYTLVQVPENSHFDIICQLAKLVIEL